MKAAKILSAVVGGVVVLIIIALLLVWLLVDPNHYKGRIEAAVHDYTHRDLNLKGDLKLSVFPWVALELGPATLGNPPGFSPGPFLAFQHAAVRVKLLPLLSKQLEVSKVELDGLDLRLEKNARGEGNWDMSQGDKKEEPRPDSSSTSATLQSIGGIKVTHGRVSYAPDMLLENFNFETGTIASGRDVPVSVSFDAKMKTQAVTLNGKLNFTINQDSETLKLAALNLNGTVTLEHDSSPMHWEASLPALDLNMKAQTVSAPEFSASLSNAKLSGSLKGTKIFDKPDLSGSVSLAPLVLKEFAPRLHVDLPKTQDPKALGSFSFSSNYGYAGDVATLNGINIKLDDTTMKGNVKLELGKTERVEFALTTDRIDLDRYRPPAGAQPAPASPEANKPAPQKPDETPLSAHGTFALGSAHAAGLDLSNLNVTVDLENHITHLHPLEAQLYGGKYSGDLTYDARTQTPALSMDEHLSQVDVAQLLSDTHLKGRVSGKASINLKGTARGSEADAIMKTLNGHFDANVANGALEGLDLTYSIAMAQALLAKQTQTSQPNTHRTPFTVFKVSADIVNGVAQTKDLAIVSPVLKVAGQGTVTLPTSGIDMALNASLMKDASSSALDVPVKVTGKYTDPTVRPDVEALAKGALKQKLQDVLKKNGLQELFRH